MENPCKPKIEEKHYSYYDRPTEQNIRGDTPKSEIQNADCRKRGMGGLFKKSDENGAVTEEILVC